MVIKRSNNMNAKRPNCINLNNDLLSILKYSERFMIWLSEEIPEDIKDVFNKFNEILTEKYSMNLIKKLQINSEFVELQDSLFVSYPELVESILNAVLEIVEIFEIKDDANIEKMEITEKTGVRAFYLPVYHLGQALISVKSRENGINLCKRYTEETTKKGKNQKNHKKNLEEFASWMENLCNLSHNYISQHLPTGKYIFDVIQCSYHEFLKDIPDKEIMFSLICYADYFSTPNFNEHFTLTRKRTLMEGHECCDFCYHDDRINTSTNLDHPDEKFWNNLIKEN